MRLLGLLPGDDEGSLELIIANSQAHHVLSLNLLVSGEPPIPFDCRSIKRHSPDTSDYPKSHTFFTYSPDSNVPHRTLSALENLVSGPSQTIREFLLKVLALLASREDSSTTAETYSQEEDAEDEGSDDAYEAFDELDHELIIGNTNEASKLHPENLQK